MLIQAAAEASKGTSSVFLDAPVIALIVTNVGLLGREWVKSRRARKSGNGIQPGKGEACQKHGEALATLKAKQEGTDQAIMEMKGHINTIEGDVKTLLQRIPAKD